MQLHVEQIDDFTQPMKDLLRHCGSEDRKYINAMGFPNLESALMSSIFSSQTLLSVSFLGGCVALVGAIKFDDHVQVWVHTAPHIRERKGLLKPAIGKVVGKLVELYPSDDLRATFRDETEVRKLARLAGFKHNPTFHDINGIKHITTWR